MGTRFRLSGPGLLGPVTFVLKAPVCSAVIRRDNQMPLIVKLDRDAFGAERLGDRHGFDDVVGGHVGAPAEAERSR